MRPTHIIVCMILLASHQSAQEIDDIGIRVGEDGYSLVSVRALFGGEGEWGTLNIDHEPREISATDSLGPLDVSLSGGGRDYDLRVFFRQYQEEGESETVIVSYGTHQITRKIDDKWVLSYGSPAVPRKTIMKVAFPRGTQIESIEPAQSLRSYVEDGLWFYPQEDEFEYNITYMYVAQSAAPNNITYEPAENGESSYSLFILVAVAFFAALGGFFAQKKGLLSLGKKKNRMSIEMGDDIVAESGTVNGEVVYNIESRGKDGKMRIKESILMMLNENEKNIVRLLLDSEEDELTQAYIHKTTGIPKSSLSDILRHIEKRKIIYRRIQGRVKWIRLNKQVLE